eukprot:COSAG04_NODE_20091_length_401_cov_0.466887_1_plen_51_part_10
MYEYERELYQNTLFFTETERERQREREFFNDTATTEIYTALNTLSLHGALP